MIRRPRIETKINHERWLVSYSDFITLLFAFFVVMYSVSQVSESKYKMLSDTLEQTFSPSAQNVVSDRALQTGANIPNTLVPNITGSNITGPNIIQPDVLAGELEQAFSGLIAAGQLTLSGNEDWVELTVNSEILFKSGSARPGAEAVGIFSEVADILAPFDNAVAVSGHTDNVPISTTEFQNNWQLSSARAVSVVNLLAFGGVNPSRLSAVGYGEYRPIAHNSTVEGRAANRRVVLRVARDIAPQTPLALDQVVMAEAESRVDQDAAPSPVDEPGDAKPEAVIEPVELKNGGLLFTSDPELPQHRRRTK